MQGLDVKIAGLDYVLDMLIEGQSFIQCNTEALQFKWKWLCENLRWLHQIHQQMSLRLMVTQLALLRICQDSAAFHFSRTSLGQHRCMIPSSWCSLCLIQIWLQCTVECHRHADGIAHRMTKWHPISRRKQRKGTVQARSFEIHQQSSVLLAIVHFRLLQTEIRLNPG